MEEDILNYFPTVMFRGTYIHCDKHQTYKGDMQLFPGIKSFSLQFQRLD